MSIRPPAQSGTTGAIVYHAADASVARPSTSSPVIWIGTVVPTNLDAAKGDVFIDASVADDPPIMLRPLAFQQGAGGAAAATGINTTPSTEYRWQSYPFAYSAGTDKAIQTTFGVPPGWTAADVYLHWTQTTALAGNVPWRLAYGSVANNESITGKVVTINDVVAAAPAQLVQYRTLLAAAMPINSAVGRLHALTIRRRGTDVANDTLAGDVGLLGVELIRTA